ncbi:hypothetical protein [Pseudonocardia alni]|uniref:Uncharacterized protein n=1 Tax=Pseudonocardia alni TaxID=33907 RepID=A0A852VYG9_PSEA5|nr:hypothetical protein [Pseudonocardia antarctica]NYG00361.1 hypothetical protein [Pseudonocardia antarctica]
MTNLPPEDQPPNPGLVPVEDGQAFAELDSRSHDDPIFAGIALLNALNRPSGPDRTALARLITPESSGWWGDFTAAADLVSDCGMGSNAQRAMDSDQVAYVKYFTDDNQTYQVQGGDMIMMARAVATLVWRPELGGWRAHHLGDYVHPRDLPL